MGIPLHERAVVGQSVVVHEQSGRYVESDEDIDGVVLVSGQDEEDAKDVQHPRYQVQVIAVHGRCVCGENQTKQHTVPVSM